VKHPDIVRMANQIAAFFAAYPRDEALEGAAGHIRDFWDPRMRAQLAEVMADGGEALTPLARDAAAYVLAPARAA
jgi:formate dehydrogenase subunit delta